METIGPDIPVNFGTRPDDKIEASELYLKLCESRPSVVVPYPRDGEDGKPVAEVRIQVLTEADHKRSRAKAFESIRNEWDRAAWDTNIFRTALGDETAKELLAKAIVSVDPIPGGDESKPVYRRLYRDAKDISSLPTLEIEALFNAYLTVQHRFGPWDRVARTQDDLEAWIRRLGEGGNEFPLLSADLQRLVELASLLAAQAYTCSAILDHHSESLPDSLVQDLKASCSAIYYCGKPRSESTADGTESKAETATEAIIKEAGLEPNTLLDLADAKAVAEKLRQLRNITG